MRGCSRTTSTSPGASPVAFRVMELPEALVLSTEAFYIEINRRRQKTPWCLWERAINRTPKLRNRSCSASLPPVPSRRTGIRRGYTVPAWFEDGKFGIFIHWGLYSVPAFDNEWYPRNMYLKDSVAYQHHLATYGSQTTFGYKDFLPRFTAEHFDPGAWATLFQQAGAKYVVPVAEHHDGFAMYDCSFTRWNAVKMGPQRDVLGELAAATRRQGLTFGFSVSSGRALVVS